LWRSAEIRRRGCVAANFRRFDAAQGYYFSRPVPADEFTRLLKNWNLRTRAAVGA
jgi:predicted signal transduction protein with EAL and GGDEF domain